MSLKIIYNWHAARCIKRMFDAKFEFDRKEFSLFKTINRGQQITLTEIARNLKRTEAMFEAHTIKTLKGSKTF